MIPRKLLSQAGNSALLFSLIAITAGLSSCSSDRLPDYKVTHPKAMVPQKFLYTKHAPLNNWLDAPVRVLINKIPLSEVFDEPVFAQLNYNIYELPEDEPTVEIDQLGITRRQLLWSLAQDHQLDMHVDFPQGRNWVVNINSRTPRKEYHQEFDPIIKDETEEIAETFGESDNA